MDFFKILLYWNFSFICLFNGYLFTSIQDLDQVYEQFVCLLPLPTADWATAPTHFYYTLHSSVGDVVDESRRLTKCFNFGSSARSVRGLGSQRSFWSKYISTVRMITQMILRFAWGENVSFAFPLFRIYQFPFTSVFQFPNLFRNSRTKIMWT